MINSSKNPKCDPWGYGLTHMEKHSAQQCLECGVMTTGKHHVVPKSLGGTRQVPMCSDCHSKVHGCGIGQSELIKNGLKKAKARGVVLGPKIKITEEIKDRIKTLRSTGMPQAKIAKEVGFSAGAVNKVLRAE